MVYMLTTYKILSPAAQAPSWISDDTILNCLLGITPICPIGTSNSTYLKLNSLSFSHLLLCFQSQVITLSYKSELYSQFLSSPHCTQMIIFCIHLTLNIFQVYLVCSPSTVLSLVQATSYILTLLIQSPWLVSQTLVRQPTSQYLLFLAVMDFYKCISEYFSPLLKLTVVVHWHSEVY